MDLLDLSYPHRLKGPQPDVEGHGCYVYASGANLLQDLRCEMQASGGCGYGTALLGKDGLIAFPVGCLVMAPDVWRQRNMSQKLQAGEKIINGGKTEQALAEFTVFYDCGSQ